MNFLKYLVQIMVMLSDIIIATIAGIGIFVFFTTPSLLVKFIMLFLLWATWDTWKSQGGFIAWTKEGQRAFSTGWDDIVNEEKNNKKKTKKKPA